MRIAIYAPYLQVSGGGEKYIGSIAEILSARNTVDFIAFKKPNLEKIGKNLNLNLTKVGVQLLAPDKRPHVNAYRVSQATRHYDLFLNQEHFTVIRSLAKTGILICEVPPTNTNTKPMLSPVTCRSKGQILNRMVLRAFFDPALKSYDKVLCNSGFTQKWAVRWYRKKVEVLYPSVKVEEIRPFQKQKIILNVGRFFVGGNCKKQLETIKIFKTLYDENRSLLKEWEYHLVGMLSEDPRGQEYLNSCTNEAAGYPVKFHINVSFQTLRELYGFSRILIHATGMAKNELESPDLMEHFGIVPVEAMSGGCVPIVISKGGLSEIVQDGVNGFLWSSEQELKQELLAVITDNELWQRLSKNAVERSQQFSVQKFYDRLKQVLDYQGLDFAY